MVLGQGITNPLDFLAAKFHLDLTAESPIAIGKINRTIMAQTLGELGYKIGAEVGVAEGRHANILCQKIKDLTLHCIDIYQKYSGYAEYADPEDCLRQAGENLKPHHVVFHRQYSQDAVKNFADKSLDFVYIDGAHDFKSVAADVCDWSKKVKVGGIVFGHDYKRWRPWKSRHMIEVRPVIDAFCYSKNIHPWFELKNDLRDDTFGPDSPGWLFVRQQNAKI